MKDERLMWRVLATVITAWVGYGVVIALREGDEGTFGDAFGALNTLFSGLAFGVLWVTLRLQQVELGLQREEIRLQRQEMQLQREEMVQSRAELQGQKVQLERQNHLTVLSARLSALPILIGQEHKVIAKKSVGFGEFISGHPRFDVIDSRIRESEQELQRIPANIADAERQLGEAKSGFRHIPQDRLNRLYSREEEIRDVLPHLRRLADYSKDLESIYEQLNFRATPATATHPSGA